MNGRSLTPNAGVKVFANNRIIQGRNQEFLPEGQIIVLKIAYTKYRNIFTKGLGPLAQR